MKIFEKFKNPTPGLRFAFAFWCGWGFHIAFTLAMQLFLDGDILLGVVGGISGFGLIWIYTGNRIKFEKEFTWMTIKNPTHSTTEDKTIFQSAGVVGTGTGTPMQFRQPHKKKGP